MRKTPLSEGPSTFEEMLEEARASFEYHVEGFRHDLTEQIYDAMVRAGLNQTQFAEKLGKTKGRITQVLDGSNNFTLETLAKISEALQTELHLTLRPRGWEQAREFVNDPYFPKSVATSGWTNSAHLTFHPAGKSKSISTNLPKVPDAFASAA
jgi:transcriptional regulator with XRE-family HTH domain